MAAAEYHVDQRVWIYDVNAKEPTEGVVTKVGRKLVTVAFARGGWWSGQFRIETGVINDNYGHSSIKTEEERTALELVLRLREAGVELKFSMTLSTEVLAGFVQVLDNHKSET